MTTGLLEELDRITERVSTLARLIVALREENHAMRTETERCDRENRLLRERLDTARDRVETLIARLSTDA